MAKAMVAGFGLLILVVGLTGCAGREPAVPMASSQQECFRSGGVWREGVCQRESGGGY